MVGKSARSTTAGPPGPGFTNVQSTPPMGHRADAKRNELQGSPRGANHDVSESRHRCGLRRGLRPPEETGNDAGTDITYASRQLGGLGRQDAPGEG